MVLATLMIALSYFVLTASNHFEWENYHWDHHPDGQHQQDPRSHPISEDNHQEKQGHFEQSQQHQGHYLQVQENGDSFETVQQDDQFQGYPINPPNQPLSPVQPSFTTVSPTTEITPVPNSVPTDVPKHRILLRQLYHQVLGRNFTTPDGVHQLAFLSSPPSITLNSQIQEYPQPQPAETQYDLPEYIEPPPPPQFRDPFNYYS